MEEILKLLKEVQEIREMVNGIDDRLKKIEMPDSEGVDTGMPDEKNHNEAGHETYENQCLEESNQEALRDIWGKAVEIMKTELTEISIDTWIKSIRPLKINDRTLYLATLSEFSKEILKSRYIPLIQKAIKAVSGEEYQLELSVAAAEQSSNSRKKDFPEFMKNKRNHINGKEQNTEDIDGYFYEGADGSQMAFWTCYSDRIAQKHTHDFDEYMVCVSGQYTVITNYNKVVLEPGDEIFIPKGTEQWGKCIAGTRTIHAFGGKRIHRADE